LLDDKVISFEETEANHKGKGPGPTCQPRRLRIEKEGLPEVQLFKPIVFCEEMGGIGGKVQDLPQGHLSILKVRREILSHPEGLPFGGG
jgi:hypothetical protein